MERTGIALPDAEFFEREIWLPMASMSCYSCHNATGAAAGTRMVLAGPAEDDAVARNMATMAALAAEKVDGTSLLLLKPTATRHSTMVDRFLREVKVAGKLSHPNVVAAYDAGQDKGVHYLIMEYIQGDNLAQLLRENGPLDPDGATAAACKKVIDALLSGTPLDG